MDIENRSKISRKELIELDTLASEKAARITCPVCEVNIIANYDLYKEYRKEWYCRRCGQRLILQA